jgi:methyl-accepting chemotaxis protein
MTEATALISGIPFSVSRAIRGLIGDGMIVLIFIRSRPGRIPAVIRLDRFKISARIGFACLVPMLAFTGFALKNLYDKRIAANSAANVLAVIETAPSISNLIHEAQRERGASVTFVNSKGQALADVMRGQRVATDKAVELWRQQMAGVDRHSLGSQFNKIFDQAETALGSLAGTRANMDALTITGANTAQYFTSLIAQLMSTADMLGNITDDARTIRQANAFAAILKRKELTGQERANGALGFTTGEFSQQVLLTITRLGGSQAAQVAIFDLNATPRQIETVNAALKGPVADEFSRMRAIALASSTDPAAVKTVTGSQWFTTATKYIDLLKVAEDQFIGEFLTLARAANDDIRWSFWSVVLTFVALLVVSSGLAVIAALSITRPVAQLVSTMGVLAGGNTDIDVPGTGRGDEIGTMAKAVLIFRDAAIEKTRLEAETAERDRRSAAEKAEQDRMAAEQKSEAEKRAAAEREAATAKVMNEFDAAVGGIVKAAMAGDFSQRVSLDGKDGVIRNLAAAMNSMCDNVGKVMDDLVGMLGSLAEGDLTKRISAHYEGTFGVLKDSANTTAERLTDTISKIKAAATEVANASAEISTSTTDLSQRTEEQAAGLEETSASMEEISVTVKKNAENAQQANQVTNSTRTIADRGGAVVAEAVGAMSRIEESSRKIADIIGVIDEIARQTNLLALNAAVEAARAGDAGRGFAVVASEVRSLAQRSSQAAKDIKDLITSSSSQVQEGVDLVNRAGTSLNEIVESIKQVADIVAGIASASNEQAVGIDQVNKALAQMDEVTQQNSALVEENAATAKTLEQQSSTMDQQVSYFQLDGGSHRVVAMKPPASAPKLAAKSAPKRGIVGRMQSAVATAFKSDPDMDEF